MYVYTGFTSSLYFYLLLKHWFNEFLISLLLLNYSKVYLWRQSASRRSTSVNQELQGMSSKFQLYKPFLFLNVSVVFRSDSEKLVHFFRLPSCKCDICCLEKGDPEVTESHKYENKAGIWPLQDKRNMGKIFWKNVFSYLCFHEL